MQGKRYSNEEKQNILGYLKNHTYWETQNKFKVSQTTLARWSKKFSTNIKTKLEEQLDPCLKMLKLIEGVRSVSIIGVGGQPIAFNMEKRISKYPGSESLSDEDQENRVAAMTAAIVSLGERVGIECGHGHLESSFINSAKGTIICIWAGKAAILTIEFDDSVDLKHIINHSFYYINRIREIIGTFVH